MKREIAPTLSERVGANGNDAMVRADRLGMSPARRTVLIVTAILVAVGAIVGGGLLNGTTTDYYAPVTAPTATTTGRTPQHQAFLDELARELPELTVDPDRTMGRVENTCADIASGKSEPTVADNAQKRFNFPTLGQALRLINIMQGTEVCKTF